MQEVGIKALKDNLSQYIGLVKKGEIVIVKDRNEVVAEIRRPTSQTTENIYVQEAILKGAIIPEKVRKTNIDGIIKKYSHYKLEDINSQEIYESLKDK
jgi:antitoxin (DNA-binding transcriptional repressor) of toxin-antitoxin stability system